jgi:hypothetical protein
MEQLKISFADPDIAADDDYPPNFDNASIRLLYVCHDLAQMRAWG